MEGVEQAKFCVSPQIAGMLNDIPVFACKKGDGVSWLTDVHDLVWEFWETICLKTGGKVFYDIPFPEMLPEQELTAEQDMFLPLDCDFWYDECHPGGFVVGYDIVGPHLHHIQHQLQQKVGSNMGLIRVALLGDSTTSYCTDENARYWAIEVANRKAGLQKYLSDNHVNHEDFAPVSYYAIPGKSLDTSKLGFVSQLSAILADHQVTPFDAILIVGGWNNWKLDQCALDSFEGLLKGNPKKLEYWIPNGHPYYDLELSGYFPKGPYPQP